MRITFVCMGAENLAAEQISAVLKENGHEVMLSYDPSLFDDKVYFCIPFLNKIFDIKEKVIEKVVAQKPDLVAFPVFTDCFKWAISMAEKIKEKMDVPIIFGGIYPTSNPEEAIKPGCVDMICRGEGEYPILELMDSMEKGEIDHKIKNIWFKKDGNIIRNELRPLVDLDKLPNYDKSLFEDEVLIKHNYMTMTSRGCLFNCSYCSQSFLRRLQGPDVRQRSVDKVLTDLKLAKERYKFTEMSFYDNILNMHKEWTMDFLERFKKEINVPFRALSHPSCIDYETAKALKDAGCQRVQLGLESLSPKIRRNFLNRFETNETIQKCLDACDKAGLIYSVDHMFGLPGETEEEQLEAARIYCKMKKCVRITCFWLTYLPKTDIVEISKGMGIINDKDIESIDHANELNYYLGGSLRDKKLKSMFKCYEIFFRVLPAIPKRMALFMINHKWHYMFKYFPHAFSLLVIDISMSFIKHDYSAIQMMRNYFFQMRKIIHKKITGTF